MHYLHTDLDADSSFGNLAISPRLAERRAAAIAKLHERLEKAVGDIENLLFSMQRHEHQDLLQQQQQTAQNRLIDLLYHYYGQYRFYVSPQLGLRVADLVQDMRSHVATFNEHIVASSGCDPFCEMQQDELKAWTRGWNTIKFRMAAASQALEHELRSLTNAVYGAAGEVAMFPDFAAHRISANTMFDSALAA